MKICKGSFYLGTACGECEKCERERENFLISLANKSDSDYWVIYAKVHSRSEIYWWRHEGKGYTRDLDYAGIYSEQEAKQIAKSCGGDHIAIRRSDLRGLKFQTVLDLGFSDNFKIFKDIVSRNEPSPEDNQSPASQKEVVAG